MRKAGGGDWEVQKEIQPGEFTNGRYSFASLPLDKGKHTRSASRRAAPPANCSAFRPR